MGFVIIAMAIDDLMITAINDNIVCKIKADLMKIFKMKDLGELHRLLLRSNRIESLSQLASHRKHTLTKF